MTVVLSRENDDNVCASLLRVDAGVAAVERVMKAARKYHSGAPSSLTRHDIPYPQVPYVPANRPRVPPTPISDDLSDASTSEEEEEDEEFDVQRSRIVPDLSQAPGP